MSPESPQPAAARHGDIGSAQPSLGFTRQHPQLTTFEKLIVGRSESSFHAFAGAAGGFVSGFVTCPLDVIKTKLQVQGAYPAGGKAPGAMVYSGLLGTARVIWKEEGVKGMYRGLGPMVLGYLPTWTVWFTVYGKSKQVLSQRSDNQLLVNFWSSIIAGGSSTLVTNPIWVIKTRLMSQASPTAIGNTAGPQFDYKSTFDAARKMYLEEGVRSYYSGLSPALLGLTHVAIQFPVYEYLRTKFTGQGMGVQAEGDQSHHWFGILSASVISKIMASSATYPHEVIRSRLQIQHRSMPSSSVEYPAFQGGLEGSETPGSTVRKSVTGEAPRYKGIVTTFKTILREEGWRAFYGGMGTNMMRAVPAATTVMLTYEFLLKNIHQIQAQGNKKLEEAENW